MNARKLALRRFMKAGLVTALWCSQASWAQTVTTPKPPTDVVPDTSSISPAVKQRILDHLQQTNLQRLRGWPGIIFYCPIEDATNDIVKLVCTRINAEIGATMAASNIKFQVAKNAFDLHFLPHMTGRLLLAVNVQATPPGSSVTALAAEVEALAHYAHAVNWASDPRSLQETNTNRSPLEVPQHLRAVLWESQLIVAGTGDNAALEEALKKGIQDRIAQFLAEFVKVNSK